MRSVKTEPVIALPPACGFADYPTSEREQQTCNEFFAGEVFAVTGTKESHNLIVTNMIVLIGTQLKHPPHRVFASDKVEFDGRSERHESG